MIGAAIMLAYAKYEKKENQIKKDLLERAN